MIQSRQSEDNEPPPPVVCLVRRIDDATELEKVGAAVSFLVDGYNLLHAMGLATRDMPAAAFVRARLRLLDWIADHLKNRAEVHMVFDAQSAPEPTLQTRHRGLQVQFAFAQTADDAIETWIATAANPQSLTVVSNDARVREAARRGECWYLNCGQFVDWLLSDRPPPGTPSAAPTRDPWHEDKPEPTPRDIDELLPIFHQPKRRPRR
ncbi:MAG: NYN domain-containing protein [Gemmataceae bacterium]|nr:NYN domain-containing protein [Gemmata sp.]MDW8196274.1 NYN domain-containing protein [Gemmataceae bacterium]